MRSSSTPAASEDPASPPGGGLLVKLRTYLGRLFSHQIVRFGLIGTVNTAFGYGLFIALQLSLGQITHYLVVLVVSNVFAILQAYVLQRWLVFRFTGGWWRGLLRFATVYFGAFLFNLGALPLLVEVLHIAVIPAQGITTVVQVLGTYTAHKFFTFGPRGGSDSPSDSVSGAAGAADPGPDGNTTARMVIA
jgi:putative flippase GtrA